MKLVYVISKHTSTNSDYKRHIPNSYNHDKPVCGAKSFSIEYDKGEPTCKRCLKILKECGIYPLGLEDEGNVQQAKAMLPIQKQVFQIANISKGVGNGSK